MHCDRAEELLSDHLEGALGPPLLGELEDHLAACASCTSLRAALEEVVGALHALPDVAPPAGLARRAAMTAVARARPRGLAGHVRFAQVAPLPVAAALVAALTGVGAFAVSRGGVDEARRLAEQGVSAGERVREHGERFVEDLRVLRVVIGTALEGRVERVNDRLEDYRRWLDRQRFEEDAGPAGRGAMFPNPGAVRAVTSDVRGDPVERAGPSEAERFQERA